MKVIYDRSSKVAGISVVPFSRLGPEQWFNHYAIASYYSWDIGDLPESPQNFSLQDAAQGDAKLGKMNTASLLEHPAFRSIFENELSGYAIHTYKAVAETAAFKQLPVQFNGVDSALREKLENKVEFRKLFSDQIRMPQYRVYEYDELRRGAVSLADLMKGRDSVVLQDELLSDGKGTFVIRTEAELDEALATLSNLPSGKRVVVSDFIANKRERSVQCCVTRYGIFVGPLQKQIIADPLLANLAVPGGAKFCGAEIAQHDQLAGAREEIVRFAHSIGEKLRELGYRGIFGVDCLVDDRGDAFVLEVNPRITGITPLLTMLWEEGCVPFYLLHILELAGLEYTIEDISVEKQFRDGSMVLPHSLYDTEKTITAPPASGLYDERAELIRRQIRLNASETGFLWQQLAPAFTNVKPGGRLLAGFTNGRVLDDNDNLLLAASNAIRAIHEAIEVKDIDREKE